VGLRPTSALFWLLFSNRFILCKNKIFKRGKLS